MNPGRKSKMTVRIRYLMRELSRQRGVKVLARRFSQAYRVLLLVSAAIIIVLVLPRSSARDVVVLQEGMVAPEDVIAPATFPVYKSEAEMTQARAEAAAGVVPLFDRLPEMADTSIAAAAAFFDSVGAAVSGAAGDEEQRRAVHAVLDEYGITASEDQVALLVAPASRGQLQRAVESAFQRLLRAGVVRAADLGDVASSAVIVRSAESADSLVRGDALTTMQQFYENAGSRSPAAVGVDGRRLLHNIMVRFARPTIVLNREATEAAQNQAKLAVDREKSEVLEGELIVAAHQRVGAEQRERLLALRDYLRGQEEDAHDMSANVGSFLYNLLLLAVLGLLIRYFRAEVYASGRSLTLVWFLVLAVAGAAALLSKPGAPWQLIPVAFAALTIATLYDGLLAMLVVFVLVSLVASGAAFAGPMVPFFTVMGGAAAALSGRVVRRRAQTWAFAAVITGAYILAAFSLGLMGLQTSEEVGTSVLWGAVNGIGCALLAVGVLPLAESFTKITTDQSLLELADVNRPLLRRLSLEAPGTYAHSINVANLAEAAAREIGANALLARVGVYYHDIGKVKKPQYFVENQPPGRNPHDKLKPVTSAGIVREHVEDGLELADEARLPDIVKAFITEHHGTQKISFFWDRAREVDPEVEPNSKDFRYGGPKPQSRETAIVLLADSVESAARTLQDPTPERIAELVDRIVGFKISEGQLDEAPLTMREIDIIKQQFVKVLTSMYHHRLDYPAQNSQAAEAEEPAVPGAS